jgi:hypothetical protein
MMAGKCQEAPLLLSTLYSSLIANLLLWTEIPGPYSQTMLSRKTDYVQKGACTTPKKNQPHSASTQAATNCNQGSYVCMWRIGTTTTLVLVLAIFTRL